MDKYSNNTYHGNEEVFNLDAKVNIHLSNGEKLTVDKNSIIFPITLTEHKDETFCSKSKPIVLDEYFHIHDGYIPELTSVFAKNEFFTINEEDPYKTKVYKTSAIVSLEQID